MSIFVNVNEVINNVIDNFIVLEGNIPDERKYDIARSCQVICNYVRKYYKDVDFKKNKRNIETADLVIEHNIKDYKLENYKFNDSQNRKLLKHKSPEEYIKNFSKFGKINNLSHHKMFKLNYNCIILFKEVINMNESTIFNLNVLKYNMLIDDQILNQYWELLTPIIKKNTADIVLNNTLKAVLNSIVNCYENSVHIDYANVIRYDTSGYLHTANIPLFKKLLAICKFHKQDTQFITLNDYLIYKTRLIYKQIAKQNYIDEEN